MSEHAATEDGHGEEHHGASHYIKIWGILVVLLVISVLGPLLEIRIVTLLTAFGIALVKAYLVCKYFMHLNIQPKFVLYFLVTALMFMALLIAGVAPDVLNHEGANWVNVAAQEQVATAMAEHAAADAPEFIVEAEFQATCGPCHGAGGAGDGAASAALDPPPADFTEASFWETRDHDHIVQTITGGGASVDRSAAMPSFSAQYDAAQIEELATYVESLR